MTARELPERQSAARQRPGDARGSTMFFREFLRAPLRTASVVPSSAALADVMLAPLRTGHQQVLVELGPGTGAFSRHVPSLTPAGTHHIAVEANPAMAQHLARNCPWIDVIHGSAADLPILLADRGIVDVDVIVSGLPWQAFAGPAGPALVNDIASALSDNGTYTQFTYSWTRWTAPARRQRELLRQRFRQIDVSSTVWRNAPPAFVYTCSVPERRPD
jgi:phosphatidylethanolamine/phosphatidyl-N-methylethanolamine N-methyltransferase